MYGNNLISLLKLLINKEGEMNLDFTDEIIMGVCAVHNGEYVSARLKQLLNIV
jgi:H+-translocating NAD(P) transhydrogenase subunit alpha